MSNEYKINLTVKDLKECLEGLPDDMDVIIPTQDEADANLILGFRHARTVGVLSTEYEEQPALCIAVSSGGLDIHSLIDKYHGDVDCDKVLF